MESAVTRTRSEVKAGLFERSPSSPKRTNSTGAPTARTSCDQPVEFRLRAAAGIEYRPAEPWHFPRQRDETLRQKLQVGHRVIVMLRLSAEEHGSVPLGAVPDERARLRQLARVEFRGPQRISAVRVLPPPLRREQHGVKAVGRPFGEAEIDVLCLQMPGNGDVCRRRARTCRDDEVDRVGRNLVRQRQWVERTRFPADPIEGLPEELERQKSRERPLRAARKPARLADRQNARVNGTVLRQGSQNAERRTVVPRNAIRQDEDAQLLHGAFPQRRRMPVNASAPRSTASDARACRAASTTHSACSARRRRVRDPDSEAP